MKAIIQCYTPKEIERIARGEQTVKVCKTAPKDTPFKVYMYCIKKKPPLFEVIKDGDDWGTEYKGTPLFVRRAMPKHYGKVVGDYVCERITEHEICDSGAVVNYWAEGLQHSCLTISQIDEYVGKRSSADYYKKSKISALHIPAVKFYDEPKELSEFRTIKCTNKKGSCSDCNIKPNCIKYLSRPPQSWQYVEEVDYDR